MVWESETERFLFYVETEVTQESFQVFAYNKPLQFRSIMIKYSFFYFFLAAIEVFST